MKKIPAFILLIAILTGCADPSTNSIIPTQAADENPSCETILQELQAVQNQAFAVQKSNNVSIGVGLARGAVGAWIPLSLFDRNNSATKQKAAQERYQQLRTLAEEKQCKDIAVK